VLPLVEGMASDASASFPSLYVLPKTGKVSIFCLKKENNF
jgi:hypothetical protein